MPPTDFRGSRNLRRKLERAAFQGAALASLLAGASCASDNDQAPNGSGTPDAAGDAIKPEDLTPYDVARLGCWGPHHDGGYMGQCCVNAHCYNPEAGEGCAPADQVRAHALTPPFPPGSGTCNCRLGEGVEDNAAGPFVTNAADPSRPPGECCYLIGSISCVGRPLMVDGEPLLAELVARADWAPFA